jgi:ligand-binding SRPBCC domain-containing protein
MTHVYKAVRPDEVFTLKREQWLPRPVEEVFPFFADARNLEELTPPLLHFRILTPKVEMRPGALIDYTLKIRGVPVRWRTEITAWEPPLRFVDMQQRGPYRLWRHLHTFEARDGGTLCGDVVEYALPRAPGRSLVHKLLVRPDLERIFDYRAQVMQRRFGG